MFGFDRSRFGQRGRKRGGRLTWGLVAAAACLLLVDAFTPTRGAIGPAREVVAAVMGPAQAAATTLTTPLRRIGKYTQTNSELRKDNAELTKENSQLRREAETVALDRAKLAELERLTGTATKLGYRMVPARVVGYGPAQSFAHTVTLDIGSKAGLTKDLTVVNGDGLVGRVVQTTSNTVTVLLITDPDSAVGGRLGSNLEVGLLRGRGGLGSRAQLDLDLVDDSHTPKSGDLLVTWGSGRSKPYVSGVPIGRVESVYSTRGELGKHALVQPSVDFSSLDVVGVVVPQGHDVSKGTPLIGAEGAP